MSAPTARAGSLQLLDGTYLEGDLGLDNGLILRNGDKFTRPPLASILRATFGEPKPGEFQPGLVLVNGARLPGTFNSLTETTVKLAESGLTIPGGEIAWAVYQPFSEDLATQIPRSKLGALLPGGDFFEGGARSADATTAKVLNPIFGPRIFNGSKKEILALILREQKSSPAAFEVVATNGSVFPVLDLIVRDKTSLTLRHPLYDGLKIDLPNLVEIRASSSRYYALETLKPSRIDVATGQSPEQSFSANKSLDGSPLRLAGQPVARGFESAVPAAISWDIPPGATAFIARVAPGSGVPAGQKLTFALYTDGKLLARTNPISPSDPPVILRTPLPPTAKLLSLRAEGPAGTGIWSDPILLKR